MEIRLTPDLTVSADLFLCAAAEKAPLVIIVHGYGNSKDDHVFQALHVATWGMHAMTVQLPNHGPWIANGRTLARLVSAIHESPEIVDGHIDATKIILAGHSFGATAVSAALGEGAPALAGILLDPAGIGRQLPSLLKKVHAPVMLIGADDEVWPTRNREYFFRFIPTGIAEISIRDAVHEDAQYPTEHPLQPPQEGPIATEESQVTFVSALTAAAFSLSATGNLDYAWASFGDVFRNGRFFNARKK
jgi:predicted alpha/beta hydrolase family esterase